MTRRASGSLRYSSAKSWLNQSSLPGVFSRTHLSLTLGSLETIFESFCPM